MAGEPNNVIPQEEANRYCLKAPIFMGREDVEQFIQEFSDVTDIALWPPRVALVQLRMALTEQAKPYVLGTSVEGIFAVLRARFGISAVDTRAHLQRLCHGPRTPL